MLEAKIKATWREVSKSSVLQKGLLKKGLTYNMLSIPEGLETAKQRTKALATGLKGFPHQVEARRIIRMFSSKPSKV